MASPRPPHSAWLCCQDQASHAIKQLAQFINLTSTILREGVSEGKREGEVERERERGLVGREMGGTGGELRKNDKQLLSFPSIVSRCSTQPPNGVMSALIKQYL